MSSCVQQINEVTKNMEMIQEKIKQCDFKPFEIHPIVPGVLDTDISKSHI